MSDEERKALTLLPPVDEDTNPGIEPIPEFVPSPPENIPSAPDWMNAALLQIHARQEEYAAYNHLLIKRIEARDKHNKKVLARAANHEAKNHANVVALREEIDAVKRDVANIKRTLRM